MAEKMIRVQNCGECPVINKHCGFGDRSWCEKLNRTVCVHTLDSDCPLEDAPRWRKYPHEKPRNNQRIVVNNHGTYQLLICDDCYYDLYSFSYWMPIPEIGE